jgi:hypothetical protein
MAFGINVTMILAAACYVLLIPIGLRLHRTARRTEAGFLP